MYEELGWCWGAEGWGELGGCGTGSWDERLLKEPDSHALAWKGTAFWCKEYYMCRPTWCVWGSERRPWAGTQQVTGGWTRGPEGSAHPWQGQPAVPEEVSRRVTGSDSGFHKGTLVLWERRTDTGWRGWEEGRQGEQWPGEGSWVEWEVQAADSGHREKWVDSEAAAVRTANGEGAPPRLTRERGGPVANWGRQGWWGKPLKATWDESFEGWTCVLQANTRREGGPSRGNDRTCKAGTGPGDGRSERFGWSWRMNWWEEVTMESRAEAGTIQAQKAVVWDKQAGKAHRGAWGFSLHFKQSLIRCWCWALLKPLWFGNPPAGAAAHGQRPPFLTVSMARGSAGQAPGPGCLI